MQRVGDFVVCVVFVFFFKYTNYSVEFIPGGSRIAAYIFFLFFPPSLSISG